MRVPLSFLGSRTDEPLSQSVGGRPSPWAGLPPTLLVVGGGQVRAKEQLRSRLTSAHWPFRGYGQMPLRCADCERLSLSAPVKRELARPTIEEAREQTRTLPQVAQTQHSHSGTSRETMTFITTQGSQEEVAAVLAQPRPVVCATSRLEVGGGEGARGSQGEDERGPQP